MLNFVPHITQKRLCVLGGDAQRKAHGGLDLGGFARATRFLAVCSRPVAFAPQSWASRFPAGFCVTADLHVCSPACLPAASTVLLRARDAATSVAGRPNGPSEGSTESVSPVPLTSVAVLGGCWPIPGRVLPDSAMKRRASSLPFDIRHLSRDACYTSKLTGNNFSSQQQNEASAERSVASDELRCCLLFPETWRARRTRNAPRRGFVF